MTNSRLLGIPLAVLAMGVLATAAACSTGDSSETNASILPPITQDSSDIDGNLGADDPSSWTPLPAPTLTRGECIVVTYTPATASTPFSGELCSPHPESVPRDVGIVLVHGGGGITGDHAAMSGWAEVYTSAGYTTLAIDYTLFSVGVETPVFPLPEQNTKASVQYLRGVSAGLGIDPNRIVLHGVSAGGRLGGVALTTANDEWFDGPELWPEIPAAVNGFIGYYATYDGQTNNDRQYYGGDRDDEQPEVRDRWTRADTIVNAGDATGPVVLLTGALDWEVLIQQQNDLAERIRAAGHAADSVVTEGAEHGYDSYGGRLTPLGEADAFLLRLWLEREFPPGRQTSLPE